MIQSFYFLVKFGLVLIYISKVYRKKSSSILLRKNMFYSLLAFSFEKHVPSRVLKDFFVENLETIPNTFLLKFSSEIFLSKIINYWSSIFTLYLTWRAFSLVCVLSVCFSFFLSSFYFYRYFPWQTLTIHRIAEKGEGIITFLFSSSTRSRTFI